MESTQTAESEKETKVIGFSGKGGVGKTTLAALFVRILSNERSSDSVLAIDSDPNMCLPELLGAEEYETLSSIMDAVKTSGPKQFTDRFASLLMENEQETFDLLPMGRGGDQGCYCPANDYLRRAIDSEVLGVNYAYDYVVMDCEAGIEHISRKTSADVDDLVIVTDGSKMGQETIKNILDTSEDVKVDIDNFYVAANRLDDSHIIEKIEEICDENGLTYLGNVPEDPEVKKLNYEGGSVFELSDDSEAYRKVGEMSDKIL